MVVALHLEGLAHEPTPRFAAFSSRMLDLMAAPLKLLLLKRGLLPLLLQTARQRARVPAGSSGLGIVVLPAVASLPFAALVGPRLLTLLHRATANLDETADAAVCCRRHLHRLRTAVIAYGYRRHQC